jgi:hypothetical protein
MSVDFHRTSVNDTSFIRGAARLLIAPVSQAFPTKIGDVITLASGVSQYNAKSGWTDLGATKTGIQITINNAEENFDVDQVMGDIASQPTSWECSVGTQLAEFTPEKMQIAWEGSAISVYSSGALGGDPAEKEIGFGQPTGYTQRRLAVLFQRPPQQSGVAGLIRGYFFRQVQRMPQESSITHAKTGEQISIPVRFRSIADTSISDITKRFFVIRDQATT